MDRQHESHAAPGAISSVLLQAIEANTLAVAAQTCRPIVVGPFVALLHPTDPAPWFNYAMPVEPLDAEPLVLAYLAELQTVFGDHQRTLRFEWTQALWPTLPRLLKHVGLFPESASPQMVCTRASWQPYTARAVTVRLLTTADDVYAYRQLTTLGFGRSPEAVTPAEVAELRQALDNGWQYGLAELDGHWAGVGGFKALDGLTEIVAVATHPALRRRGVAATLTSFLVQTHFAQVGEVVFLFAADAAAQAVYARVGFQTCAVRLSYVASQGSG